MPARKERLPLQKHTLNLFEGDFIELGGLYPRSGAIKIIREMVHRHIAVCKEKAQRDSGALASLDIQLADGDTTDAD